MPDYRIEWSIDWPGDSPRQAVETLLAEVFAGITWPAGVDHFVVTDEDGNQYPTNVYETPEEDTPMPEPPAPTCYRCDNCLRLWTEAELQPIKDVFERVAPGEPMPAGECPACGALCHAVPSVPPQRFAVLSHDGDEQVACCDFVTAADHEAAEQMVLDARVDHIQGVAAVYTAAELRELADRLDAAVDLPATEGQLRAELGFEIEEEEADITCADCGEKFVPSDEGDECACSRLEEEDSL